MAELIESRSKKLLNIQGFLYYKHSGEMGKQIYWECKNKESCKATAITSGGSENIEILKGPFGPKVSVQVHAPNLEEVEALKHINNLKKKVTDQSDASPAILVRNELRNVLSGIFDFCSIIL